MKYVKGYNGIVDTYDQAERYGMTIEEYNELYPFSNSQRSDNIQELCDRFVICGKPDYYELYEDFDDVKDLFYGENVTKIYGAIWTDKGLIFVAQLNNKGKLELL